MLALSRTKSPLFRPSLFHEKAIVHVGGEPFGSRYALQHDVASQPDVVLSSATSTTEALLQQTRTIPIIFGTAADPVGSGLVASLPTLSGEKRTSHFKRVKSVHDLGRVKTSAHEKCAELFSLLSCPDNRRQHFCFSN